MTLTVRLPETIESQLTRFCEAMGMSKSQVVQGALKEWFAKPALTQKHPLLAFAEAAAHADPSADWVGPYSKDRLRDQVLASGVTLSVGEPVASYQTGQAGASATRNRVPNSGKRRAGKATGQANSGGV